MRASTGPGRYLQPVPDQVRKREAGTASTAGTVCPAGTCTVANAFSSRNGRSSASRA